VTNGDLAIQDDSEYTANFSEVSSLVIKAVSFLTCLLLQKMALATPTEKTNYVDVDL